jgi:myo-inositol-1(or 4)-monophosphatase
MPDPDVDTDLDLDRLLDLAVSIAREAGELITRLRAEGVDVAQTKSSPTDVVTRADSASEELVRRRLAEARPDDAVHGEEGDDLAGTSGVTWVVDPIDGTVNYLYGIPDHAVSIAAQVDGRSVVGVVHAPALGTTYTAVLGRGSWRDGHPLHVAEQAPGPATALVSTGFAYRPEVRARQGRAVAALLPQVRDIRRRGSCALDLCGLAAGESDAYVEEGPHLWDHAAGGLVATEAGARLEVWPAPDGEELVVAAHAGLFDDFADLVRACGFGLAGDA